MTRCESVLAELRSAWTSVGGRPHASIVGRIDWDGSRGCLPADRGRTGAGDEECAGPRVARACFAARGKVPGEDHDGRSANRAKGEPGGGGHRTRVRGNAG